MRPLLIIVSLFLSSSLFAQQDTAQAPSPIVSANVQQRAQKEAGTLRTRLHLSDVQYNAVLQKGIAFLTNILQVNSQYHNNPAMHKQKVDSLQAARLQHFQQQFSQQQYTAYLHYRDSLQAVIQAKRNSTGN